MPLYEFQCAQCKTTFEELVRMGSKGEGLSCPHCGGSALTKQMSTFSSVSGGDIACQFADSCASEHGGKLPHGCGNGCGCHGA